MKAPQNVPGLGGTYGEDMILFSVGTYRLAIPAQAVDEIQSAEGLSPYVAPPASRFKKVRFTLVHKTNAGTRSYFIVDAGNYLGQMPSTGDRLLILRHASCALLVDSVHRMVLVATIVPLPRAFTGDERRWYRGLAIIDGEVVPVLDAEAVLTKADVKVLQSNLARPAAAGATA